MQPGLDLMLLTHDHKDVRIAVHEVGISCVLDKSGAEEHDVVKLAFERAPEVGSKDTVSYPSWWVPRLVH